jgi:hypothetical protein
VTYNIKKIFECPTPSVARDSWVVWAQNTAYNRTVYASPPIGGSGSVLARSIASLIPTPKRRKQPERYAKWGAKLVGKILGHIDKIIEKNIYFFIVYLRRKDGKAFLYMPND